MDLWRGAGHKNNGIQSTDSCSAQGFCQGKICSFENAMQFADPTGGLVCMDPEFPCGALKRCQPKNQFGSYCTSASECSAVGMCTRSQWYDTLGTCLPVVPTTYDSKACLGDKSAVGWMPIIGKYTCVEPAKAYAICGPPGPHSTCNGECYQQRTDDKAPDGQEYINYCAPFPNMVERYGACKWGSSSCDSEDWTTLDCGWTLVGGNALPHPTCVDCSSQNPFDLGACQHKNSTHIDEIIAIVVAVIVIVAVIVVLSVVTFGAVDVGAAVAGDAFAAEFAAAGGEETGFTFEEWLDDIVMNGREVGGGNPAP